MISIVAEFDTSGLENAVENFVSGVKKVAKGVGQAVGIGTDYAGRGIKKAGEYVQQGGEALAKDPLGVPGAIAGAGIVGAGTGAYLLKKKRDQNSMGY